MIDFSSLLYVPIYRTFGVPASFTSRNDEDVFAFDLSPKRTVTQTIARIITSAILFALAAGAWMHFANRNN